MALTRNIVLLAVSLSALSCQTKFCREGRKVDPSVVSLDPNEKKPVNPDSLKRVRVYKYDGSLQCGMGTAIPTEVMAQELKSIKVFSSSKKPDGLMRAQLCGSPTGMANVYEIAASDLPEAEKYGFKKWAFGD